MCSITSCSARLASWSPCLTSVAAASPVPCRGRGHRRRSSAGHGPRHRNPAAACQYVSIMSDDQRFTGFTAARPPLPRFPHQLGGVRVAPCDLITGIAHRSYSAGCSFARSGENLVDTNGDRLDAVSTTESMVRGLSPLEGGGFELPVPCTIRVRFRDFAWRLS